MPFLSSATMFVMVLASFGTSAEDPDRFPVTLFDVPDEKPAGFPSAVVLDDCDPDFDKSRPHRDGLRILQVADSAASGRVKSIIKTEFNTCQTIGGSHALVVDVKRGRIYLSELAGYRVTALDLQGRKIWQVCNIASGALAIAPKTGRLWCSVGHSLGQGETVVLDPAGREVASFPVRGQDMVYDPHTDAFWLAGTEVTKLSREGKVLFQERRAGWAFVSVAVNSIDGSVWIVERAHQDVPGSVNRVWHRDANGAILQKHELGKQMIFGVACEPKTGTAWVTCLLSNVLRFTAGGDELRPFPVKARAVAVSPTTGRVWLSTEIEALWLDEVERPHTAYRFAEKTGQSWLAAF